jgi:hypothetical protein
MGTIVSPWCEARPRAGDELDALHLAEVRGVPQPQGLTLIHFSAKLEDRRDTLLTLELKLSTFGPPTG